MPLNSCRGVPAVPDYDRPNDRLKEMLTLVAGTASGVWHFSTLVFELQRNYDRNYWSTAAANPPLTNHDGYARADARYCLA